MAPHSGNGKISFSSTSVEIFRVKYVTLMGIGKVCDKCYIHRYVDGPCELLIRRYR